MITIAGGILLAILILVVLPRLGDVIQALLVFVFLAGAIGGLIYFAYMLITKQLSEDAMNAATVLTTVIGSLLVGIYFYPMGYKKPTSLQLFWKLRVTQLVPALTMKSGLKRIKRIEAQRKELEAYSSRSRLNSVIDAETEAERVKKYVEDFLGELITSGIVWLNIGVTEAPMLHDDARVVIAGYVWDGDYPAFKITIHSQATSPSKCDHWYDFSSWGALSTTVEDCSPRKTAKLSRKAVFKEGKNNSALREKLLELN